MPEYSPSLPEFTRWPSFPFEGDMRVKRLADPVAVEPPRSGEDAADCVACNTPDDAYIWVSERWRVRAMDRPTGLPMVLILECRSHLDLGDLPNLLAAELGVMTVRLERAIRSLDGVARVHVNRWGDGSAHLHMWFLARPYGRLQLRGTFLSLWDDILPVIPEEQWRGNLALVAAWLAEFGGRAIAEPPHIHWESPSTFSNDVTLSGATQNHDAMPLAEASGPSVDAVDPSAEAAEPSSDAGGQDAVVAGRAGDAGGQDAVAGRAGEAGGHDAVVAGPSADAGGQGVAVAGRAVGAGGQSVAVAGQAGEAAGQSQSAEMSDQTAEVADPGTAAEAIEVGMPAAAGESVESRPQAKADEAAEDQQAANVAEATARTAVEDAADGRATQAEDRTSARGGNATGAGEERNPGEERTAHEQSAREEGNAREAQNARERRNPGEEPNARNEPNAREATNVRERQNAGQERNSGEERNAREERNPGNAQNAAEDPRTAGANRAPTNETPEEPASPHTPATRAPEDRDTADLSDSARRTFDEGQTQNLTAYAKNLTHPGNAPDPETTKG